MVAQDFKLARANMVYSQVYVNGVLDPRILDALRSIPRESFVPYPLRQIAYIDRDIPVNAPQEEPRFLMEPMCFSRLVEIADISDRDMILDVGCNTGYSSALLACLGGFVIALESDARLADLARENLPAVGVDNVSVVTGTLADGYSPNAPYDVIFLGGALDHIPQAFFDQCKEGGRIVAVLQQGMVGRATLFKKQNGCFSRRHVFDSFVKHLPGSNSAVFQF